MPPNDFPIDILRTILVGRANNDNDRDDDNNNRRIYNDNNNDDDNSARNHRRVEIGVIVAIVVAGLALIGVVTALIMRRRKKQRLAAAKVAEHEITWYGPEDVQARSVGGGAAKPPLGGQEGGVLPAQDSADTKDGANVYKKVGFVEEGGDAPPRYEIVAKRTGDEA